MMKSWPIQAVLKLFFITIALSTQPLMVFGKINPYSNNQWEASVRKSVMRQIYSRQHPSDCKVNRLLVIDLPDAVSDGVESVLMTISSALAIAEASNRVLVWGNIAGNRMFDMVQAGLQMQQDNNVVELSYGSRTAALHCSSKDSGLHSCFFKRISNCSLSLHVGSKELRMFEKNPHNDSARVMLATIGTRSLALYGPPSSDLIQQACEEVDSCDVNAVESFGRQLWASAVASYVFRLKSSLATWYEESYRKLLKIRRVSAQVVWGIHVYRGEAGEQPERFRFTKRTFHLRDYLSAAANYSNRVAVTPTHIFVSTDDPSIGQTVNDDLVGAVEWHSSAVPAVIMFDNKRRQRQRGCVTSNLLNCFNSTFAPTAGCSLSFEEKLSFLRNERELLFETMLRVWLETIEDIYVLSKKSSVFFGTGTSHRSAFVSLLLGAFYQSSAPIRTDLTASRRSEGTPVTLNIDEKEIENGIFPTALLGFTDALNGTFGLDPTLVRHPGYLRWRWQQFAFIGGLVEDQYKVYYMVKINSQLTRMVNFNNSDIFMNPWDDRYLVRLKDGLPFIHPTIFDRETASWRHEDNILRLGKLRMLGKDDGWPTYPRWPGCCAVDPLLDDEQLRPILQIKGSHIFQKDALVYMEKLQGLISRAVNMGVDQLDHMHKVEAVNCFHIANYISTVGLRIASNLGEPTAFEAQESKWIAHQKQFVDTTKKFYTDKIELVNGNLILQRRTLMPSHQENDSIFQWKKQLNVGNRTFLEETLEKLESERRILLSSLETSLGNTSMVAELEYSPKTGISVKPVAEAAYSEFCPAVPAELLLDPWMMATRCCTVSAMTVYINDTGEWGRLEDYRYFPNAVIPNRSSIFVFTNDFILFLQAFSQLPDDYRVVVVAMVGDYGTPVEVTRPQGISRLNSSVSLPMSMTEFLNDARLVHLYAQNYDIEGCFVVTGICSSLTTSEIAKYEKKITPVPIGMDFHTHAGLDINQEEFRRSFCAQFQQMVSIVALSPPFPRKQFTIVASFSCQFMDAPDSFRTLGRRSLCKLMHEYSTSEEGRNKSIIRFSQMEGLRGRSNFWIELGNAKYAFAPVGRGVDTHRVWEILSAHSIPIVVSTSLNRLYRQFPVIILDRWEDLFVGLETTLKRLTTNIQRKFGKDPFNDDVKRKLTMRYWVEAIRNSTETL